MGKTRQWINRLSDNQKYWITIIAICFVLKIIEIVFVTHKIFN